MAGVEDPPRAGRAGGFDRRRMTSDGHLTELVDPDKHLCHTLERLGQGRWLSEIAPPHPHAALRHRARLLRIADAEPDLVDGDTGEQLLHDAAAQLAVGARDDDHAYLQMR